MALSCQYSRKIASWPTLGGTLGIPEPKSVGKTHHSCKAHSSGSGSRPILSQNRIMANPRGYPRNPRTQKCGKTYYSCKAHSSSSGSRPILSQNRIVANPRRYPRNPRTSKCGKQILLEETKSSRKVLCKFQSMPNLGAHDP